MPSRCRRRDGLTTSVPLPEPPNDHQRDREDVQDPPDNDQSKRRAVRGVERVIGEAVVGNGPEDHNDEEGDGCEKGGEDLCESARRHNAGGS